MTMGEQFFIWIPDPTYDHPEIKENSDSIKSKLESEYDVKFRRSDIGAGADFPAFLTHLVNYTPVAIAIALFFSGKKINENLEAWIEIGKKLRDFSKYNAFYNRASALCYSLAAFARKKGNIPQSVELKAYKSVDIRFGHEFQEVKNITGIDDDQPSEKVGYQSHVFKIFIDGEEVVIIVRRSSVEFQGEVQ